MTNAVAPHVSPEAPQSSAGVRPSRTVVWANLVLSQLAWFAAVLGAAHGMPVAGTLCVLLVIGWHLMVSERPGREACLVALVGAVGFGVETGVVLQGNVAYPSGQPSLYLAPYWMVALWGLFAIALNVSLRWLRQRPWLAAVAGALMGPLAFTSGVRLGGAQFVHTLPAVLTLAIVWAMVLPLLLRLSERLDGVQPDLGSAR